MKKITLFFIVLFLIPAMGYSDCTVVVGQPVASGGCTTPDNGDELDEGFPSPTDLTWTDSGSTITVGADLPGTGPNGTWNTCDTGARFQADNSSPWKYYTFSSAIARTNDIDITLILYVDDASLDGYGTVNILSLNNSVTPANNLLGVLSLRFTSGTTYDLWASGDSASSHINIALDTYYKVTIHLDSAHDGTSNLDVDSWNGSAWGAVSDSDFTRYDSADGGYLHVGPYSGVGSGETLDIYVGLVSVDTP